MKSIQLGSTAWFYEEKGAGRPLVLVHGFPMDHRIWQEQLDGLAGVCRVIAVDLKGFGKSRCNEAFTIDSMADELLLFLKGVGAYPCVLAGLSMGGYIALSLAARYPEAIKGLVIVSSKSEADTLAGKEARQKMAQLAQEEGNAAVAEQMLPRVLTKETVQSKPDLVTKMLQIMEACPANTIANASFAMRERPDRTGDLPALKMPVLVMLGAGDTLIPAENGRKLADACPNGRLVLVEGAGHVPCMENPKAANAALAEFVVEVRWEG
jgi:pimeloyl-ACP methyl ester carboxylesterase